MISGRYQHHFYTTQNHSVLPVKYSSWVQNDMRCLKSLFFYCESSPTPNGNTSYTAFLPLVLLIRLLEVFFYSIMLNHPRSCLPLLIWKWIGQDSLVFNQYKFQEPSNLPSFPPALQHYITPPSLLFDFLLYQQTGLDLGIWYINLYLDQILEPLLLKGIVSLYLDRIEFLMLNLSPRTLCTSTYY